MRTRVGMTVSSQRRRSRFTSRITTSAPRPAAINAALIPAVPPPTTSTRPGKHAGDTAEQHPFSAARGAEVEAADERAHAAGDLAHGFEQGQAALLHDRFIGEAGGARGEQRLGERAVRREVQVSEEGQLGPQVSVFVRQRLLHLHDEGADQASAAVGTRVAPASA